MMALAPVDEGRRVDEKRKDLGQLGDMVIESHDPGSRSRASGCGSLIRRSNSVIMSTAIALPPMRA